MPDGSNWDVPCKLIAGNRAAYYAARNAETEDINNKEYQRIYKEEFDVAMKCRDDGYDIKDWAANNMDWKDVKNVAINVSTGEIDFQEGWVNGDKEIVEK